MRFSPAIISNKIFLKTSAAADYHGLHYKYTRLFIWVAKCKVLAEDVRETERPSWKHLNQIQLLSLFTVTEIVPVTSYLHVFYTTFDTVSFISLQLLIYTSLVAIFIL